MGTRLNLRLLSVFRYGPVPLVEAFNVQRPKIVRYIFKILQQVLQEFQIVADHFGTF